MRRIFKYPLQVTDMQELELPADAEILSVINQQGSLVLYAFVEDAATKTEQRHIEIIGTGNPTPPHFWGKRKFIGTVQQDPFVWHVFERQSAWC